MIGMSIGQTTTEAQPSVYDGFDIDYANNFINGGKYTQIDIGTDVLTYEQAIAKCVEYANGVKAYGFFY
jgi:hypothetical protein